MRRKQTLGLLFTVFDVRVWKLDKDPSFIKSGYKGQEWGYKLVMAAHAFGLNSRKAMS